MKIERYYSSLPNMLKKYDRFARKDYFQGTTLLELEDWKKEAERTLAALIGLEKMDKVSLEPREEECVEISPSILRKKIILQTEEDVWMPCYILIPQEKTDRKKKVILALPGHQGAGKYSVAGCEKIPCVKEKIDFFQYDYGLELAKMGYVTVCPDCRGFGERREEKMQGDAEEQFIGGSCYHLTHMAEPLGETAIGMLTWDIMKLIDYLETQQQWDISDLICLGFSGGGMQTLYAAALDKRIKKAVISGYLYGFRDSLLLLNGNCNCNYVPHLWEHFDCADIATLISPRPLVVQSCKEDHLNGPRGMLNVVEQMDIIRKNYGLYHAEARILHDVCEGGHSFHKEKLPEIIQYLNQF